MSDFKTICYKKLEKRGLYSLKFWFYREKGSYFLSVSEIYRDSELLAEAQIFKKEFKSVLQGVLKYNEMLGNAKQNLDVVLKCLEEGE